jgi:hypothetical protein
MITSTFGKAFILTLALLATATSPYVTAQAATGPYTPPPPHEVQTPAVEAHLKRFDNLDFDVFSNQK